MQSIESASKGSVRNEPQLMLESPITSNKSNILRGHIDYFDVSSERAERMGDGRSTAREVRVEIRAACRKVEPSVAGRTLIGSVSSDHLGTRQRRCRVIRTRVVERVLFLRRSLADQASTRYWADCACAGKPSPCASVDAIRPSVFDAAFDTRIRLLRFWKS